MPQQLAILARTLVVVGLLATTAFGCATDDATTTGADPITGTWDGGFTSDNTTVSSGTFTFMITEDGSHAVSGSFTGTAAGQNLAGTVSGKRDGNHLEGTISVTTPIALMLTLPDAAIADDTISGNFSITTPIMAKGNFSVTKK